MNIFKQNEGFGCDKNKGFFEEKIVNNFMTVLLFTKYNYSVSRFRDPSFLSALLCLVVLLLLNLNYVIHQERFSQRSEST